MRKVLDKGYVRLRDTMGSDLTVVNAARVSYDKRSEELSEKDEKLIKFLAKHNHHSPFRAGVMQFEVYAPLLVARQWWKYAVSSSHVDSQLQWNESSRRYITEECEFYIPTKYEWRSLPKNSKQGSGEPIDDLIGGAFSDSLQGYVKLGEELYNKAMEDGVCAEQARLFLPAYGLYVRWIWTASLQSVAHFLKQRLNDDAQKEIQLYAKEVYDLTKDVFPVSLQELLDNLE